MNKQRIGSLLKILVLSLLLLKGSSLAENNHNDINPKTPSVSPSQDSEAVNYSTVSKSNSQTSSGLWIADNGNGTYKNPVLYADYSDPDVIRVNDDYYMTASSFASFPGLPILHSKDLVNWTLISHALPKYPNDSFDRPQHGNGVWAPSIRHQNGWFYIYWGDPDEGIYMVRSKEITGPWQQPVLVLPGKGLIDPCPFWDEDGKAYLVHGWAASRAGINSILTIYNMNPEGNHVDPNGKHVFDGNDSHHTIEGPKMYKRNGYYYILAPAGGVKTGWQVALRSKNIFGPYEDKIVLEQGAASVNGPHQGGWIDDIAGQSWFIHFQDRAAYGRIVHLQPVNWENDWPLMGKYDQVNGKYEPVMSFNKPKSAGPCQIAEPAASDEFDTDDLGLQWQWHANPQPTWYAKISGTNYLRLFPHLLSGDAINLWDAGNLLLQKFPAPDFTATTKVTFTPKTDGQHTGLVIMGMDYACLSLTEKSGTMILSQVVCIDADKAKQPQVISETKLPDSTVYLRVKVSRPNAECKFSYSTDGQNFTPIGQPFQAQPGRWIGAKVGLFCTRTSKSKTGGYADYEWFRVE